MVKWVMFFVVSALVVFAATLFFRLGAYKAVTLNEPITAEFFLLYKDHVGPYHKIISKIHDVEKWAALNNLPCQTTFGRYLDNPKTVEEERLQSQGGCIVSRSATELELSDDLKALHLPPRKYLTAEFEGAPSIGPLKVYPKATEWLEDNGYKQFSAPVIEVYQVSGENVKTTYYFPLEAL